MKIFGASIGVGGRIKPNVKITCPWLLSIGDHCWLGENLWIDNLDVVTIGDNVCLSQGVYICTGNHDFKKLKFDLCCSPVVLDSESWIAAYSRIGPGSIVGRGAVVAFGSVVTGTVSAGSIVRGNPAVTIRQR